jgi:transposase
MEEFDMDTKQKSRRKKKIKVNCREIVERKLVLPFVLLLANKFLNMIGFSDFIDRSVEWDAKHWNVSPGNLAKAVILVTFLQIRAPLYKIKNSFIGMDTEALFGKGVMPEHLNDDAIARALDRISDANPEGLFSTLCLSLYSKFSIEFNRLHSDTTSISFYGAYETTEDTSEDSLKIVHGYNKDNRPECKQVVLGKIVNEHGMAVASSTMNGNTSDIEWNQKALQLVKETFGKRLHEVTYIADSKLINLPTFKQLMDPESKIRFISRCPSNFNHKVANKVIHKAYQNNEWIDVGKLGQSEKACTHKMQEFSENIDGYVIRLIVVQTSAGKDRFDKKLEKQRRELEKDFVGVNKKNFACKADALKEWEIFKKEHKKTFFLYAVDFNEIKTEKRLAGNPGKNPKPPTVEISWQIDAKIDAEDEITVLKSKQEEECFVLITSIEKSELDGAEILRQYKSQIVVEMQFKLLKEPALASAIYIKTPERINALVMLLNISLLIRALIQFILRKNLKESQEEAPRIGWDRKKLENPTIKFIIDALQHSYLTKEPDGSYYYDFCNKEHNLRVTTILKLLGITVEDFLEE